MANCDNCDRTYAQPANLKRHLETAHYKRQKISIIGDMSVEPLVFKNRLRIVLSRQGQSISIYLAQYARFRVWDAKNEYAALALATANGTANPPVADHTRAIPDGNGNVIDNPHQQVLEVVKDLGYGCQAKFVGGDTYLITNSFTTFKFTAAQRIAMQTSDIEIETAIGEMKAMLCKLIMQV